MNSSRREQTGWYFYDWANSAFSSTVVTLFLGPYLTVLATAAADAHGRVYPLGIPVDARSWWGYLISLSVLSQVVCLPILGAMADYSARKKTLLGLFAYAGAIPTVALYFVRGDAYLAGGILFLLANLAFGASAVVYNSYLPQIAAPEERDAVSSKGWGLGYLGGGILLALNLVLYVNAGTLGLNEALAVRISLASAGLWWAGFTIIPLATLRRREPLLRLPSGRGYLGAGFGQLLRTLRDLRRYPQTLTFLVAYLLYNDAIQAVIALAAQFGADELKVPISILNATILMVQFVAFLGALAFNRVARATGAKNAVMLALAGWTVAVVAIYGWVRTVWQFVAVAAVVALVMGGSQALSRSLYSLMVPKGREAEYFSLYEISDKGTSWLCPLIFGLTLQFTGNYRLAILTLVFFFLAGMSVLALVNVARAAREAGNQAP